MANLSPFPVADMKPGLEFDFGSIVFSEEDIIDFASRYDPLPFHTDPEYAKTSHFGALVASGPHIFNAFYLREWVPRFGHSVFAGRGVSHWEMLKPVYAGKPYFCKATLKAMAPKPGKGYVAVSWYMEFTDAGGTIVQRLELVVMHHLNP